MVSLEFQIRFHEKWELDKDTGCWEWIASKAGLGYGQIKIPKQRKQIYAHRLSYLIFYGGVPDDLKVCHTCDNPGCVNPSHLFLGTTEDNAQDMKEKGRHLFGEKNSESKFTEDRVRLVHELIVKGLSQSTISKQVGISKSYVSKIARGERWEHIYKQFNR